MGWRVLSGSWLPGFKVKNGRLKGLVEIEL